MRDVIRDLENWKEKIMKEEGYKPIGFIEPFKNKKLGNLCNCKECCDKIYGRIPTSGTCVICSKEVKK